MSSYMVPKALMVSLLPLIFFLILFYCENFQLLTVSTTEVKIRIKKYLKAQLDNDYGTPEKWIRGIGWDQANFGGAMPTAVNKLNIYPLPDITSVVTYLL